MNHDPRNRHVPLTPNLGLVLLAILAAALPAAAQTPGALDTSFGGTGFVTTPMNPGGMINDLLVQADGKIVAIGRGTLSNGNSQWAIVRYMPDGTLDSSFGVGGKVLLFGAGTTDQATDGQLDSLGRIVLTGRALHGSNYDFTVVRLNASNGSLDTTFDGDGIARIPMVSGNAHDYSHALGIDPTTGKIVVAGLAKVKKSLGIGIARLHATGALDTTFDRDGKRLDDFGTLDDVMPYGGVVVQPDGRVLVAGGHGFLVPGSQEWVLARYNVNGANDSSFGSAGKVYSSFPGEVDHRVASLALQPDGRIVACGRAKPSGPGLAYHTIVARYLANGAFDPSFDADGWTATQAVTDNQSHRCALQLDGKIVAIGTDNAGAYGADFVITRFHVDGSIDTAFDGDGQAHSWQLGTDAGLAIALDGLGRILAGGYANVGGTIIFAAARFWN